MKKKRIITFISIIIFIILIVCLSYYFNLYERIRLKIKGYSIKEQNIIINKVDNLNTIYKNNYIPELYDILNNKDMKKNNIEKYINYYQKNNIEGNKVIFMVNNNLENEQYSDKLYNIITCENYDKTNLEKYIDYINNYLNQDNYSCISVITLAENDIKLEYNDELSELLKEKYFIKSNINRYLDYKNKNNNLSNEDIIRNVNANIDYNFYTNIKSSDTSKGKLMIVNKYYNLSSSYKGDLVETGNYSINSNYKMDREAFEAYKKLYEGALKNNLHIKIRSAYRSYFDQQYIYNGYVARDGKAESDRYSARAGHSEHQTGLAIDISAASDLWGDFSKTQEFTWMKDNSYKYGFILRYPKDKEYITGYMYEPWHYRYVGVDVAKYIYENNITYDEYYAYFIENKGE